MKKVSVIFAMVLMVVALNSFDSKAFTISIKVELGKRNAEGNCGPGRGICSITIGGSLNSTVGTSGSAGTGIEVVEGNAELKADKLYVTIPKGISENGKNERGSYSVSINKNMTIDQAVAKQLGVASLTVLPGNYELRGNTFVFDVKSPRDAATGQSSGKRNNIAIDEPGVQKVNKATYDLKENKK